MKRITRLKRLRDCGIFRDFSWPADLPEFGRYNLIYGWNGSGKTTISRLLRAMETKTAPTTGQATVVIDGQDVPSDEFAQVTLPIRVFNRDFIAESVFPVSGGDLAPIFVLGKENVEMQKEVDRLKAARAIAASHQLDSEKKKRKSATEFDKFCTERAKDIKDRLRSEGSNRYNNYDKADFKLDAEQMAAAGNAANCLLTDEEGDRLRAQLRATPKPKVSEVTYDLPDLGRLAVEVSELLGTTVVSKAIQALKDDPALTRWTREGLGLHRDRKAERCLFCQQSLPSGRLAELEAHFNAQYEQFIQRLDQMIRKVQTALKEADDLQLPNKAELYDDLRSEYELAVSRLRETIDAARGFLDEAGKALVGKKGRVFEGVECNVATPTLDHEAVGRVNSVIRKHNQACDEFQNRVDEARERLALGMIAEQIDEFARLKDAMEQADRDFNLARQEVQRLNNEIERLEREIVQHRQPAEELNDDLRKYLGHNELQLEIKDTGYTVTRNGVPAQALSEGETTAIALLYFLKSLQDRRFNLEQGVVVLDDPVSSLDANALYLAFGFIRERTQNAGQLIILTHNFAFFRQVRNWFHHLKGQNNKDVNKRPARFFMVNCKQEQSGRCATIRKLDPLLEQYDSEYHYLFSCIYHAANATEPTQLEDNYALPNMARRLLEAFLAFRQPEVAGELWQKVQAAPFDGAKKLRILRFLHTHSHSTGVGEPEHDPSILAEAGAVLNDLLEFIETQDEAHFDAMVKLVNPEAAEEDDR